MFDRFVVIYFHADKLCYVWVQHDSMLVVNVIGLLDVQKLAKSVLGCKKQMEHFGSLAGKTY